MLYAYSCFVFDKQKLLQYLFEFKKLIWSSLLYFLTSVGCCEMYTLLLSLFTIVRPLIDTEWCRVEK